MTVRVCRFCGEPLPERNRGSRQEFCSPRHKARFHAARKTEAARDAVDWLRRMSDELDQLKSKVDGTIHRLEQGLPKKRNRVE